MNNAISYIVLLLVLILAVVSCFDADILAETSSSYSQDGEVSMEDSVPALTSFSVERSSSDLMVSPSGEVSHLATILGSLSGIVSQNSVGDESLSASEHALYSHSATVQHTSGSDPLAYSSVEHSLQTESSLLLQSLSARESPHESEMVSSLPAESFVTPSISDALNSISGGYDSLHQFSSLSPEESLAAGSSEVLYSSSGFAFGSSAMQPDISHTSSHSFEETENHSVHLSELSSGLPVDLSSSLSQSPIQSSAAEPEWTISSQSLHQSSEMIASSSGTIWSSPTPLYSNPEPAISSHTEPEQSLLPEATVSAAEPILISQSAMTSDPTSELSHLSSVTSSLPPIPPVSSSGPAIVSTTSIPSAGSSSPADPTPSPTIHKSSSGGVIPDPTVRSYRRLLIATVIIFVVAVAIATFITVLVIVKQRNARTVPRHLQVPLSNANYLDATEDILDDEETI